MKTLAGYLSMGPPAMKAARLRAFLGGLGVENIPDDDQVLEGALVHAERKDIDLEIWLPESNGKYRAVVIEEKCFHSWGGWR